MRAVVVTSHHPLQYRIAIELDGVYYTWGESAMHKIKETITMADAYFDIMIPHLIERNKLQQKENEH